MSKNLTPHISFAAAGRLGHLSKAWIVLAIALHSEVSLNAATNAYDNLHRLTRVDYDNGTSIAYTYDTAGNRLSLVATKNDIQPDHVAPILQINLPTSERLFVTSSNDVTLAGTASDNEAVTSLTWTNSNGLQGLPVGTGSWTFGPVSLSNGVTKLTVSASDAATNVTSASLTVVCLGYLQESSNLLTNDYDGDGLPDWAEFLAGTSYSNDKSFLAVGSISSTASTNTTFLVEWASVTGTLYSVNRATNLFAANAFVVLKTNIPGLAGTTQYTDTNAPPEGPSFYHISVDY